MSDYTKKNIEHFDQRATTYDTPSHIEFAGQCSEAFLHADGVDWDPQSTVLVDFACGTGLISYNLISHVAKAIGLDTSQGMVDEYNKKATNEQLSSKMHALCIDILSLPTSAIPQEIQSVDVVVCAMSFHHIKDVDHVSKVLASLLKKGGYLLVLDLLQNDISDKFHCHDHGNELGHVPGHGHGHGHGHHHGHKKVHLTGHTSQTITDTVAHVGGLSKERLLEAFTATELLENVASKEAFEYAKEGMKFSFIMISGRKK